MKRARAATIKVSVNLMAKLSAASARRMSKALRNSAAAPRRPKLGRGTTTIEILLATLYQLREYGVRIALDDVATGYSGLSELRWIPLGRLKID